ncbi:hypothetical protein EMIT0347P_140080 [Pseudomonas sp. IT-347P]
MKRIQVEVIFFRAKNVKSMNLSFRFFNLSRFMLI